MNDTDNKEHTTTNMIQPATSQSSMDTSVKKLERNPKYVKFYEKK